MQIGVGIFLRTQRTGGGVSPDAPIAALFANGEQGGWYDPSDLTTLSQDTAGTTPVTAAGQPVRLIRDKSGRNHHFQALDDAAPATLRADGSRMYLDGLGDGGFVTNDIDMTGGGLLTVCAGFRKTTDVDIALITEFSSNLNNRAGAWYIAAPIEPAKPALAFVAAGTSPQYLDQIGYPAPISAVLTGQADIAAPLTNMRINGVQSLSSTESLGTGPFGNWPLYLGRRGGTSLPFTGRLYGLIVRAAASTAGQVNTMETYMNGKTGAY